MQLLRQHHDAQWELLPLHELRQYERVLVVFWDAPFYIVVILSETLLFLSSEGPGRAA